MHATPGMVIKISYVDVAENILVILQLRVGMD